MRERLCSKVACAREAVTTLTYDYGDQMAAIGPMFGQVGFFHKFAGREFEDKRPLQRYVTEPKRLLGVLETRLDGRDWLMDEYSIADIATLGWVRNLITFYEARELVEYDSFARVGAWLERMAPGLNLKVANKLTVLQRQKQVATA